MKGFYEWDAILLRMVTQTGVWKWFPMQADLKNVCRNQDTKVHK